MIWIILIFIFSFTFQNIKCFDDKELTFPSVEKNLTKALLDTYKIYGIYGRPVSTSDQMVSVQYGLQLIQILDLDENQQILRTNCWSMYRWHDQLLQWHPSEHGNITELRVFPDQIWTPDIKLYNFADIRLKEQRVARVVLTYTGDIYWIPQAIYKSTCSVEISYFPFDTQVCMLEFGSWTYDINQLDIQWWIPDDDNKSMPYIYFSDYLSSPEWETDGQKGKGKPPDERHIGQIRSVKKLRTRTYVDARGNKVTRHYPVLRYLVKLRRNPSFYVSILVIPCVLLSSLTLVVFWLPPESPAKMMLGMSIFVAFFILLQLLNESTPSAVRKFPLIGAFFCLNMVMITLSSCLATIVINLYNKGHTSGPLPKYVRRFMIEGLGRILMVRQFIPLPPESKLDEKIKTRAENGSLRKMKLKIPNLDSNKFLTSTISRDKINDSIRLDNNFCFSNQISSNNSSYFHNGSSGLWQQQSNRVSQTRPGPITDTEDSPLLMHCHTRLEKDVRELKRCLRVFVSRQKQASRNNLISMEWRTLALVLDRLFFVLYVSAMILSVIVSLPNSTEPEIPSEYRD